ncbi:MAG: hypothetical protein M9918_13390 [Anaerolineae bacterium]|nr:hypothetical protein [Anaerolineae bacterium]
MADAGLPSITIAGTTFDDDDCVQSAEITVGGVEISYYCGADTYYITGAEEVILTFTLALAQTDTTAMAAIARGTSGVCEFHPFGDTATYIEYTTTNGTITNHRLSSNPAAAGLIEVTCRWDDVTIGAAT